MSVSTLGENHFTATPGVNVWVDLITTVQNANGLIIRTLAWHRDSAVNGVRFVVSAYDGVNDRIIHGGITTAGAINGPLRLPAGWGVRVKAGDSLVNVSVSWDDLP